MIFFFLLLPILFIGLFLISSLSTLVYLCFSRPKHHKGIILFSFLIRTIFN